jgi:lipopolysaccharide/colanic/teichoic acid biosynthesis glycosyltransferase
MVFQRTSGLDALLTLCIMGLVTLLFWIEAVAVLLVFYSRGIIFGPSYSMYCTVILIGLVVEKLSYKRPGANVVYRDFLNVHYLALRQTVFGAGLLLAFIFVTKDMAISRIFLVCFVPSMYLLLFLANRLLPVILSKRFFPESRWEKTLLVGRVAKAETLRPWLERKADVGYRIVGIICDDDPWEMERCPFPRLGGAHELVDVVRQYGVTQVIRTEMPTTTEEQQFFMEACDQLGVRLLIVANLPERWGRPLTFLDDDGVRFIGLREEAFENPFNRLSKRVLDLTVSSFVLLFILPVTTLAVWYFQRRQSPGPIFYRQSRAGLQNREIKVVKYRTLHLQPDGQPTPLTLDGENHNFPAAKVMRRFRIDLLPQFWNVFKGEMSVVGSRSHMIEQNAVFARKLSQFQVRTLLKPGVTGLAQVRGLEGEAVTDQDIAKHIIADIEYLENWRPALDAVIILQTLVQVFNIKSERR